MPEETPLVYGGDFSIIKKLEDYGAVNKFNGVAKKGLQIFKESNYSYVRLRIFHTPDYAGPVCNDLKYTIALQNALKNHSKVTSVFYWEPDSLDFPESKIFYLGRGLFDKQGNAFKGIGAWKE